METFLDARNARTGVDLATSHHDGVQSHALCARDLPSLSKSSRTAAIADTKTQRRRRFGPARTSAANNAQTNKAQPRVGPTTAGKNAGSEGGESGRLQEKRRLAPGHTAQRAHLVRIAHAVSDTQHEAHRAFLYIWNDMYIRIAPQLAQTRRAGMRQRRR